MHGRAAVETSTQSCVFNLRAGVRTLKRGQENIRGVTVHAAAMNRSLYNGQI